MIDPRVHLKNGKQYARGAGRKCVAIHSAIHSARCVAVAPPPSFAFALSPWSGGSFYPRLTIPPDMGRRPDNPAVRAFVPSPSLLIEGDFALPRRPIAHGRCPWNPRDGRAALTHPAQPCADWMPPCRGPSRDGRREAMREIFK
jgi:hypothetical protein